MAVLEAMKRDNIPAESLTVWYSELNRHGMSEKRFIERCRSIRVDENITRIAFRDFLKAHDYLSRSDAEALAEDIIEQRKREYMKMKDGFATDEELLSIGLMNVREHFEREYEDRLRAIGDELMERIMAVRKWIVASPDPVKQRIRDLLLLKADGDDPVAVKLREIMEERERYWAIDLNGEALRANEFWREGLHFYAPYVFTEVEEMMKN